MLASALPTLGEREFRALRDLIGRETGIHLTDAKRQLVASRLASRLRVHGLRSYREYCDLLARHDPSGAELREMVNCITTNKTSFFRESHHFDFLRDHLFAGRTGGELRIWSAGCSTGEEPYTLAMTAREHFGDQAAARVRIEASDIDTRVLATAKRGVYDGSRAADIPASLRGKYLLRGTGEWEGTVRVHPQLQRLITFRQLNLVVGPWPWERKFDVIVCRNVIIYFDAPTRNRLMERFAQQLRPGGFLILGHSETLHPQQGLFEPMGQTVFRLRAGGATPAPPTPPRSMLHRPLRPRHRTLVAGEIHADRSPELIRTVLGSCVAACLYDPVARVGGMNHFMLPHGSDRDATAGARFGVHAMELLINEIARHGGDRRRLQAKVFGAASVLCLPGTVPEQNAEFIRKFLAVEGIPLVAENLGGTAPLDVRMQPSTGQVWVRTLGAEHARRAAEDEQRYLRAEEARRAREDQNDVTLFLGEP